MMSIQATLVTLSPETEYQDTVYEWRGVLQLDNGVKFGVFDPDLRFEKEQEGQRVDVILSLFTSGESLKTVDDGTKRIAPNPREPTHWENHTFYGQVEHVFEVAQSHLGIRLNVGDGAVLAIPRKDKIESLDRWDFLEVRALRTDVLRVREPE